jgi:hypothetical protein
MPASRCKTVVLEEIAPPMWVEMFMSSPRGQTFSSRRSVQVVFVDVLGDAGGGSPAFQGVEALMLQH